MKRLIAAIASTIFVLLVLLLVAGCHWCSGKPELDAWLVLGFLTVYVFWDSYKISMKYQNSHEKL